MRITELDRRRAIKRFPEFIKEYSRYEKLKTEKKKRDFEVLFFQKWNFELWQIVNADDTAKVRQDGQSIEIINYNPLPGEISQTFMYQVHSGETRTRTGIRGKFLYLKISRENLETKTEKQLIQDFRDAIAPYRKKLLETRQRGTDTTGGLWPIYDEYLKNSRNMNATTQVIHEVSGNPAPMPGKNEYDEKYYKRTVTAVKNAESIISAVRSEYNLKPLKILKGTL